MTTVTLTNDMALGRANDAVAYLEANGTPIYIKIFDDTPTTPADVRAALSGPVELVQITLNDPSYNTAVMVGDVAEAPLNESPSSPIGTATNAGTAHFYRTYDFLNNPLRQGSITVTGGDGNIQFPSLSFSVGQKVKLTS